LPLKVWLKMSVFLTILAIIGCLVVMFTPIDEVYQAHRWIRIGSFSFQVAELVKLAILIYVAKFLAEKWNSGKIDDFNTVVKPLAIALLVIGFVMVKLQSDFGSAAVVITMIGLMAYAAGIPLKRIVIIVGLIAILATLAITSTSYRRERVTV
jgi:cell division protein FtsW